MIDVAIGLGGSLRHVVFTLEEKVSVCGGSFAGGWLFARESISGGGQFREEVVWGSESFSGAESFPHHFFGRGSFCGESHVGKKLIFKRESFSGEGHFRGALILNMEGFM